MAKKVYTLEIDEKNLKTSAKSKAVSEKKSLAQSEVESYGIVEINNASASKKIKTNADKGFEKIVSGNSKKAVKSELHKVDDYFDFNFRPQANVEPKQAEPEYSEEDDLIEFIRNFLNENSTMALEAEKEVKPVTKKATAKKATTKATAKKCATPKAKTAKIESIATEIDNKTATILKVESEHIEEIRTCQVKAEVAYDDDARYNISIARMGSLFDCEKTMLN